MTINIFVLKGDLNGKMVVVRFFFCRVYYSLFVFVKGRHFPSFFYKFDKFEIDL